MLDPQAVPGLPCTRHRSLRPPASLRTTPSTGAPCARGAAMVQLSSHVSNTGCRIAAVLPLQASTFIAPAHVHVLMCLTATAEPVRKPCPALALDPPRDGATVSGPTDITQAVSRAAAVFGPAWSHHRTLRTAAGWVQAVAVQQQHSIPHQGPVSLGGGGGSCTGSAAAFFQPCC